MADTSAQDWGDAENQIKGGKSTTVSVKNRTDNAKRKPGDALAEAHREAEAVREKKKSKKGR